MERETEKAIQNLADTMVNISDSLESIYNVLFGIQMLMSGWQETYQFDIRGSGDSTGNPPDGVTSIEYTYGYHKETSENYEGK